MNSYQHRIKPLVWLKSVAALFNLLHCNFYQFLCCKLEQQDCKSECVRRSNCQAVQCNDTKLSANKLNTLERRGQNEKKSNK